MKDILIIIAFIAVAFGGAYLLIVGALWVLTALLDLVFTPSIEVNVWFAGLIVWLATGTVLGIKSVITKKN